MSQGYFTIVAAVNDMDVLHKNLLMSPDLINNDKIQIIIKRNCQSASLAYNEAIEEAKNNIILFVHQDVYLPEAWFEKFKKNLVYFEKANINWGVLGCFGTNEEGGKKKEFGCVHSNGWGTIGREIERPESVQTLDEIVLIVRKSSGLRFDPLLPHFHMYGTDICMSAREIGLASYAIPAFCIHNTTQIMKLPKEFYECYRHIKKQWGKYLPIYTSCIKISRFDGDLYLRRVREFYARLKKDSQPAGRASDPRSLLKVL